MHASRKNKRAKQVIIHTCIVSLFTSVSWMFAGAGQNFLPTPWDTIFFFSRFVLDIDVIVFGCMFFIYFKLQRFFKPSTVAIIVAVNGSALGEEFCGRLLNDEFLNDLPEGVDPCGENGEFHTFCFDGPIFKKPVDFMKGEVTRRSYPNPSEKGEEIVYYFCDLV